VGRALAAVACAAAAAYASPGLGAVGRLRYPGVARRLEGRGYAVALTFDDGPHPEGTPAVLDALREAGAPATFFLAGEQVAARPALAAEIVAAGHRVELHCFRHRNQLRLTPRQLIDDAERGRAAIELATSNWKRSQRKPVTLRSQGIHCAVFCA